MKISEISIGSQGLAGLGLAQAPAPTAPTSAPVKQDTPQQPSNMTKGIVLAAVGLFLFWAWRSFSKPPMMRLQPAVNGLAAWDYDDEKPKKRRKKRRKAKRS